MKDKSDWNKWFLFILFVHLKCDVWVHFRIVCGLCPGPVAGRGIWVDDGQMNRQQAFDDDEFRPFVRVFYFTLLTLCSSALLEEVITLIDVDLLISIFRTTNIHLKYFFLSSPTEWGLARGVIFLSTKSHSISFHLFMLFKMLFFWCSLVFPSHLTHCSRYIDSSVSSSHLCVDFRSIFAPLFMLWCDIWI